MTHSQQSNLTPIDFTTLKRLAIIVISTMLYVSNSLAADETGYLVVHSAHTPVEASGCPSKNLDMSVYPTKVAATAEAKRLNSQDNFVDHRTDITQPEHYSLVYKYQKRSAMYATDCQYTAYGVIDGDDEDDARRKLKEHVREYKPSFLSDPEIVRIWTGGSLRKVKRNYDGVEVVYLTSQSGESTAVLAKVRNTRTDKKVLLRFQVNGVFQLHVTDLNPGESANVNLGRDVKQFVAEPSFVDPAPLKSRPIIKRTQDVIRDHFRTKNGTVEIDNSCMCVRG